MRLHYGKVLFAAGALAALPTMANAQLFYSGCATGSSSAFQACASAEAWFDAGTGSLFINVTNLNESTGWNMEDYASATGGWHTIRAIGLDNLSYVVGSGGLSLALNYDYDNDGVLDAVDPLYWQIGANSIQIENTGSSSENGHMQGIVGAWDPGPAGKQHLATTDGRYVQFVISGFSSMDLTDASQFSWHGVQVAEEDCVPSSPSGFTGEEDCLTENSLKGTSEVVPEPITLVLLGTGLAGVGGAAARRRRRQGMLEEEDGLA